MIWDQMLAFNHMWLLFLLNEALSESFDKLITGLLTLDYSIKQSAFSFYVNVKM